MICSNLTVRTSPTSDILKPQKGRETPVTLYNGLKVSSSSIEQALAIETCVFLFSFASTYQHSITIFKR